jgi:hypothetical protein
VLLACLAGTALAAASPLYAQSNGGARVHVGLTGGISYPGGDLKSIAKTGWNAGALLTIGSTRAPLSLRIEGQWNQFNGKPQFAGDRPTEYDDLRVLDVTANAVYTIPSSSSANLYFIAGAGIYNERGTVRFGSSVTNSSATNPGVNVGAGVRLLLGRLAAFVELRSHYLAHGANVTPYGSLGSGHEALHYWPLSVGIVL